MELLRLERSPAKQAQAASAILFTQWLIGQGRLADAAPLAESIASRWSHAAAVDGKSPAQWLNDWRQEFSGAGSTSWPRGRISVEELPATAVNRPELTRRAQAEFQLGLRKLRIGQTEGPACGPSLWLVAQDGSRLIGRDAAGQEVFRFNVSRRSAMRRFAGNSDFIEAAQLGDLLYVTLGGQIVAIDTRQRDENDDSDVVWQSNGPGRFSLVAPRSVRPSVAATAGGLSASLGPVTSGGVVFQEQQQLRCVDPLSGETLWSRNDLPLGCELFGDDEFVLAADSEAKTLDIYRFSDGELVQRRELPESPWLLTAGRHVAQLLDTQSGGKARKTLRILDAVSGKKLFEADYDPGVRMSTLEPNYIAVVEPSGAFELIDVRSMDKPIATKLRLRAAPRSITLFRSGNQLFLCVSGPARLQSSRPIGIDYPLVDGEVFAFDLRDGRMIWPGAAVIDSRGIALTQPEDTPVLIFVDRFIKRDAGGSGTKLRLLCLDRDTGATIYRNDNLPDTSGGQFRIRASHGDMNSVDIEMTAKTIRLKSTKLPRSPEPPANDLVEAPRKSLGRGLWGVTRRMGSVLQDVIQNSSGSSRGANPEDENEGQTDDD
jgi:outer membrane protein assembly factor BamB